MSLPILKVTTTFPPAAIARQWVQSELLLSQALCEPLAHELQVFCGRSLSPLPAANRVLDAFVPAASVVDPLLESVDASFAAAGCACEQWSINATTPGDAQATLAAKLAERGFVKRSTDLMVLQRSPTLAEYAEELQLIPGRTSPAAVGRLFGDSELPHAAAVGVAMTRFVDEPRLDSLLALENGKPIGFVGVLTLGQVGRVMHAFVAESHRGRGVGATLMSRAMEICARSLFHHVFVADENPAFRRLCERFGFRPSANVERYELGFES